MAEIAPELLTLADHKCQLCEGTEGLSAYEVPSDEAREQTTVLVCGTCRPQLAEGAELDPSHWFCLQGAIWSEHPAVQVLSWRLLDRLTAEQVAWAREQLEQAYLAEEILVWAKEGRAIAEAGPLTRDSNGAELAEGDDVTLIKDLDVKGTSFVAKRGTKVRGIHLTDDPGYIEGKVNGVAIMLKTEFLKKA